MSFSKKIITVTILSLTLAGCTMPGSGLSTSNKNIIVNQNKQTDADLQKTPIEQVNVYPLTNNFISLYKKNSQLSEGRAKHNSQLDKQLAEYEYAVGVGDILNITVWDHPELTIPAGSYRSAEEAGHWVHADGKIFFPYIDFVDVEGKTVKEIRANISKRLARFIEDPQVDVNIAAFRSQKGYVTGEVKVTGKQAINNIPLTLLDAINNAGGLTADADWKNVTLTRNGKTEVISLYKLMQKGDLTENRLVMEGDIIHVPRNDSQKVFVLGDVKQPEMLKIDREGMTLTEALSSVGGINELSADATGIFVIRSGQRDQKNAAFLKQRRENFALKNTANSNDNAANVVQDNKRPEIIVANIYQLDIKDAAGLVIGTEFKLEPYDVVYVTASPIERYNRVIRQLLPTIGAVDTVLDSAVTIHTW